MGPETHIPQEEIIDRNSEHESKSRPVVLSPHETFPSKLSPIFESPIRDAESQEIVGNIDFQLLHKSKKIIVQWVMIHKPRQGYGVETYKRLQEMYPDYQLVSSGEMRRKESPDQEKPNAVYLWEKLVNLGLAEGDEESGFRMKK